MNLSRVTLFECPKMVPISKKRNAGNYFIEPNFISWINAVFVFTT
jgi:hypothetical protein